MNPISDWPGDERRRIAGLFTDIDDTLTTDGQLTAAAYAALSRAKDAGLMVIPVTGRPAGWCDHIARMWPVDAVVGENGAFYFRHDAAERRLERRFVQDEATRTANRARLAAIRDDVLETVPGTALASDQHYRENDLAIDYREDVRPLGREAVARIVAIAEAAGAQAKVSSIHVNIWFGDYDKLSTTRWMMRTRFGIDLDDAATRQRYAFAGDSPNDAPMFAFFPNAVGVANVRDFAADMDALPSWVTAAASGAGFAELVDALVTVRG